MGKIRGILWLVENRSPRRAAVILVLSLVCSAALPSEDPLKNPACNPLLALLDEKPLPRFQTPTRPYDEWNNQKSYAEIAPFSRFDTDDPGRYPDLPKTDLYGFLKKAHARARHYVVEVTTAAGERLTGRVRRISTTEIRLEIATGEMRTVLFEEIDPEKLTVTRDDYRSKTLAKDPGAKPSDLARDEGILYVKHRIATLETLIKRLEDGKLVPIPVENNQWRTGNYLELVVPNTPPLLMYTSGYVMVFHLKVLDRTDYFVSPFWNYGTKVSRTAQCTDRENLAGLFFELAHRHGGISMGSSGNEMVTKDEVAFDALVNLYVEPSKANQLKQAITDAGLPPPEGRTWEDLIVVSEKLPDQQLTGGP